MTTLLSFFSTAPYLVTSPSAEWATTTPLFYVVHLLSFGLPWWRKPSTLPSKIVSAKFPALPLVTCPKYCSFIRATFPINSLSRPIFSNIDILVRCSFQEIPSIFLQHHSSKDSILFLSDFFNVHPSTPYWNTAQTSITSLRKPCARPVVVYNCGRSWNTLSMTLPPYDHY